MSTFSECCRQLLSESESSVYEISKESGLDRTSIQRMITGKRMPSIQFVEKFCDHLRITPIERAELLELYRIEKIGKELYQNRMYIKNMIENLTTYSTIDSVLLPNYAQELLAGKDLENNDKEYFSESANKTTNLLEYIILKELHNSDTQTISSNLPVAYKTFFRFLEKVRTNFSPDAHIQHLFILNKAPIKLAKPTYNLEVLYEVLSVMTSFLLQYLPRYVYSKSTPSDSYYHIYPYYVITTHHVLCISSDYKKGILYSNQKIIKQYQEEFNRLYFSATPFTTCIASEEIFQKELHHLLFSTKTPSHIATYTPLFFSQQDKQDNFEQQKTLKDKLSSLYQQLNNKNVNLKYYFSSEPIDSYLLNTKDKSIFKPGKHRLELEHFFQKAKNMTGFLFKKSFLFPEVLTLLLYNTTKLQFLLSFEEPHCMFVITIDESSICKSFLDFFDSLEDSGFVYSAEETEQILLNYF